MNKTSAFILILVSGEIVGFFLFKILNYRLLSGRKWEFKVDIAVFKGTLERLFLFLSLVYGIPHALIAFGAIKIGTRFKPNEKISNDYFFIGNIISVLLSVCYYAILLEIRRSG